MARAWEQQQGEDEMTAPVTWSAKWNRSFGRIGQAKEEVHRRYTMRNAVEMHAAIQLQDQIWANNLSAFSTTEIQN